MIISELICVSLWIRIHLDLPTMPSLVDENRESQREERVRFIFYISHCVDYRGIFFFNEDCELVNL